MLGKMMKMPLTIPSLLDHAARYHAATELVSVETEGGLRRSSWGELARRAKRLASALEKIGLHPSDRCATIAWNNLRHLEIYFGVTGAGMICHTINPRNGVVRPGLGRHLGPGLSPPSPQSPPMSPRYAVDLLS